MNKTIVISQSVFTNALAIFVTLVFTNCNNPVKRAEKIPILKADREAPIGWVYLTIYQDSTFVFTGNIRSDKDAFKGKVEIHKDSLFFVYSDRIPKAGKTAVLINNAVEYVDGEYRERLIISYTELTK